VFSSDKAPSDTDQIESAIAEASSKTKTMRLPWLCKPAKAAKASAAKRTAKAKKSKE
jgi:hypothetical protein